MTDLPAAEELRERVVSALTGRMGRGLTLMGEQRVLAEAADAVLDAVRPLLEENERLRGEVEVLSRQVDALEFEASVNEWIGEDEGDDD